MAQVSFSSFFPSWQQFYIFVALSFISCLHGSPFISLLLDNSIERVSLFSCLPAPVIVVAWVHLCGTCRAGLRWTVWRRGTIAGPWRSLALWRRWTWASACLTWRTTRWGRSLMPSSTTSRRWKRWSMTSPFEALSPRGMHSRHLRTHNHTCVCADFSLQ